MNPTRALFTSAITIFALTLGAQTVPTTLQDQIEQDAAARSIKMAEEQFRRISALVDAGALPRLRLEQAKRDLADAQDAVILDRTLYGRIPIQSLTEEMGTEMVAAA